MHRIPVRQIMTEAVITIGPQALVADAAEVLEEYDLRRLPVVDDEGYLVGIVTDSDVAQAEAAQAAQHSYEPGVQEKWLSVAEIMTRDVATIDLEATVGELATVLSERKVGGVPVVARHEHKPARERVVGIVTETDIFRMIADAWRAEISRRGID